jgi:hypothetical protein
MSERIVKVWAEVESLEGDRFFVRCVRKMENGIELVRRMREAGIKSGYDFSFKGEKMSSKQQVKLMYAFLREKGVEVV